MENFFPWSGHINLSKHQSTWGSFILAVHRGAEPLPCLSPSPCSGPDESSSSGGRQLSSPERRPPAGSDTDSSVEEESDFDTMPEIESDKNIIRTKVWLLLQLWSSCWARTRTGHFSKISKILFQGGFHLIQPSVFLSLFFFSHWKFSRCDKCAAEVGALIWKIRMYWGILRKEENAQRVPQKVQGDVKIGRK